MWPSDNTPCLRYPLTSRSFPSKNPLVRTENTQPRHPTSLCTLSVFWMLRVFWSFSRWSRAAALSRPFSNVQSVSLMLYVYDVLTNLNSRNSSKKFMDKVLKCLSDFRHGTFCTYCLHVMWWLCVFKCQWVIYGF